MTKKTANSVAEKPAEKVIIANLEVPSKYSADPELDAIWEKICETADQTSLNFLKDNLLARLKDKSAPAYSVKMLEFLTQEDEKIAKFMIEDWEHREVEENQKQANLEAAMNIIEAIYHLKSEIRIAFSSNNPSDAWWAKF